MNRKDRRALRKQVAQQILKARSEHRKNKSNMTPDEMRARSGEKVKQVTSLMEMLHLKVEARERIDEMGFIQKTVFWIDDEKYPAAEPVPEAGFLPAAPTEEQVPGAVEGASEEENETVKDVAEHA